MEAMRKDAWEKWGGPVNLPLEAFENVYLWGRSTHQAVKACPLYAEARPDPPDSIEGALEAIWKLRATLSKRETQTGFLLCI